MKKNLRGMGFYLIIFLVLILVVNYLYNGEPETTKLVYSDIVKLFEEERVESFELDSDILTLKIRGQEAAVEYRLMSLDIFMNDVGELIKDQRQRGVLTMDYVPAPKTQWWMSMVPYILVLLVFGFLWFYVINNATGGGGGKMSSFGKAKTKIGADEKKKVTFREVAGADEEKEELKEVVDFLKDPLKFVKLGARIPKGVLLIGPPGTGKTLLAKAVAGEAGVPFLSISGSDFVEMFVGVGASRVRDLFDQAKKNSPAIVFIDEIDAVGRQRGAGLGGGHDEREQTLNQLLVEMDGFGVNEGVIVMAATNRSDILDPALTRAGRFDRQIYVGVPDIKGREEILKVHSVNKPLAPEVQLGTVAKETIGFTGADLENLLNEAALLAARRDKKQIEMPELEEAAIKVMVGPEKKSRVTSPKEKMLTCYHEAGHAVVTRLLKTQDPVHQISIVPRGRAGGYTLALPKEDKYYMSKNEMFESIVVLLGGRVAEKLTLEDISTGASNDLERASKIARQMVTKYGMSDKLGPIVFGSEHDEVFIGRDFFNAKTYSESMATEIDAEVKKIIDGAYEKCEKVLNENINCLHEIAKKLFEIEKMDGPEFEKIMQEHSPKLIQKRKEQEEKEASEKANGSVESPESPETGEEGTPQVIAPEIDEGEGVIGPDVKDSQ